ncbi:hypothetical protein ACWC5C_38935 [Streptomyces sp. NPDC001700]
MTTCFVLSPVPRWRLRMEEGTVSHETSRPRVELLNQVPDSEQRLIVAVAARLALISGTGLANPPSAATWALGVGQSDRWQEAVSTALLGSWADSLSGEGLDTSALDALLAETKTIHRQLTPLWQRRTGARVIKGRRVEGKHVVLLETPCGENLTLRDLLAQDTCPEDPLLDRIPGDRRLARLLVCLNPAEREVVLALGLPGIKTWAEAAEHVGADNPPAFGERVRRRVRRLAIEQRRRDRQQCALPLSGLWQPSQEEEQQG